MHDQDGGGGTAGGGRLGADNRDTCRDYRPRRVRGGVSARVSPIAAAILGGLAAAILTLIFATIVVLRAIGVL